MCGIAAFISSSNASQHIDWLSTTGFSLGHRGPDDTGYFYNSSKNIGLAHTRLSIQDTSALGAQPYHSKDKSIAIIFNGEIYNFKELRLQLIRDGFTFKSNSDTEVLLTLYTSIVSSNQNIDKTEIANLFLRRLNGIFSLIIWDSCFNSLLVARDAFGVKPLYCQTNDTSLYFSSEIKAFDLSSSDLDHKSINRYLTFLWSPGADTPASDVSKFPPGHAAWIDDDCRINLFKWYTLPCSTAPSFVHKSWYICQTQNLLRRAVQRQLVADVPVGAFLSGGLDSSSIVSFARNHSDDFRAFTISSDTTTGADGFSDDLPFAKYVARHLDVPLEIINVDSSLFIQNINNLVYQLDEPLADPAALNVFFISQLARDHGFKVLLSGTGGDDLFTGYRRHLAQDSEYLWSWLPSWLRIYMRKKSTYLPSSYPLVRRFKKFFSGSHLEGDERLIHYFRWIDREDLDSLYSPEFRLALGQVRAEAPMLDFISGLPDGVQPLQKMLALEQRYFLTDHNLTYTDKMSMAVGVEVRVPFLDPDLVEFASRIPLQLKQRGRHGKWVLKKAMEPYLPKEVIYRRKSGFGVPLRSWMQSELRDWLCDILSYERLHRRGLFDPCAVHRLISANFEGRIDASYTLLSLAFVEIWCTRFIDRSSVLP